MSIEGALPPHPPPLEPNPGFAVNKVVTDPTVEALNAALSDQNISPSQIITVLFAGGKYHTFYRTVP
jgi:hypothetical protein